MSSEKASMSAPVHAVVQSAYEQLRAVTGGRDVVVTMKSSTLVSLIDNCVCDAGFRAGVISELVDKAKEQARLKSDRFK